LSVAIELSFVDQQSQFVGRKGSNGIDPDQQSQSARLACSYSQCSLAGVEGWLRMGDKCFVLCGNYILEGRERTRVGESVFREWLL